MAKKGSSSERGLFAMLAYCIVLALGIVSAILVTVWVLGKAGVNVSGETLGKIINVLRQIAYILAIITAVYYSYRAARGAAKLWFVLWVLALLFIIAWVVIGFIG
ncbi:hypothetical protein FACS1894211_05340 [Clostridia bacterium]|nr:hypothetical protein FACS1894211_05340 [Clostridia bacterium]